MSYLDSDALCPYFKYDKVKGGINLLCCEIGTILFNDKEFKKAFGYRLCAENYNQCPSKKILDNGYDLREAKSIEAKLKRIKGRKE